MPLISMQDLRNRVRIVIPTRGPQSATKVQKLENIANFNGLERTGLQYGITERKVLLYETLAGEKVYMQYPGLESARAGVRSFPLDARPVLQKADGSYSADMDFKKIWDIIDRIGQNHKGDIDILATLFLKIAYMIDYQHNHREYLFQDVDISTNTVVSERQLPFVWNSLSLDRDISETLNDRFGLCEGISVEGFLYYNDLLAQNEDCKYHHLGGANWKMTSGRINNCLSHLTVISHIRDFIGISKLIDSFQRTGVAPLPQNRFHEACGDLVIRR